MNSTVGIPTKYGIFYASYSITGLFRLEFPRRSNKNEKINNLTEYANQWHQDTTRALNSMLLGEDPIKLPPLDLSIGTQFQQNVWQQLLKIPYGRTKSYSKLAEELNKPKAYRAVGNACGANPIPIIIPCHRALAAKYHIGGYSGETGWKQRLLNIEGATFIEKLHS